MTTDCGRFADDWALFVLGSLEPELCRRMQSHLSAGCALCEARYRESLDDVSRLGEAAPPRVPAIGHEARFAARLLAVKPAAPPIRRREIAGWIAAAALTVAVWLAFERRDLERRLAQAASAKPAERIVVTPPQVIERPVERVVEKTRTIDLSASQLAEESRRRKEAEIAKDAAARDLTIARARVSELERALEEAARRAQASRSTIAAPPEAPAPSVQAPDSRVTTLNAELERARAEMARQTAQIVELRRVLRILESNSVRLVDLRAVDPRAGRATARVLFSPSQGLLLLAHDLPALPAGKCYQLWIIRKGSPAIASGGLLKLDVDGHGVVSTSADATLAKATGFAITDEPAGGSIAAQGRKLLFGAY